MKNTYKSILKVIVILAIGFWVLSKIPFYSNINQEITANIYEDGVVTGETTVFIEGERSNYLFSKEQNYWGRFYIDCFERTGRDGMNAGIRWNFGGTHDTIQKITYSQNATFPLTNEIAPFILINEEMNQFAVEFADGRIIAVSDEMYQKYMELSWTWR
jgi:hypothetical protein